MTRRYNFLASLTLLAAALTGCDETPARVPSADSGAPGAEPTPGQEMPAPAADDGDDVDCEPAPVVRPRVVFVLDKSSSMTHSGVESGDPAEHDGVTRWAQLHALVWSLTAGMGSEVLTGAVLFPSTYAETSDEAVCDVRSVPEAAVGPYRAGELVKLLPPAHASDFHGGSPAQAAYATALDHLDGLGGSAPTAIVLITDGGLNCADDEAPLDIADRGLAELVGFARESLQIQTFVIGIGAAPGDQKVPFGDADELLREIALAGGAAHGDRGYFTVADASPLVQALGGLNERAGGGTASTSCR